MIATAFNALRDQTRSFKARQTLCISRTLLALIAGFMPWPGFLPAKLGPYNILVISCLTLIASYYGPLIAADRIDGRVERGDLSKKED